MAATLKPVAPVLLTAALATVYTVPAAKIAIIVEMLFCNTDSAARLRDAHFVPSGGSASDTNKVFFGVAASSELQAGETQRWPANTLLNAGDFIQAKADVTLKVSMRISVVEVDV